MLSSFFTGAPSGGRRAAPPCRAGARTLAALITALGVAACGPGAQSATDVAVNLSFDPEPRVGDTVCTVELTDTGGAPLEGAVVEVEGNMNHAGMVPVFGDAAETAPGVYEAPMEFTMGGDWFFVVRAELDDGRSVEEILDVPGVAVRRREGSGSSDAP